MFRLSQFVLALFILWCGFSDCLLGAVLFDGSLGNSPVAQGWTYLSVPLFGADASVSTEENYVRLKTFADVSEQAGFFSKIPFLRELAGVPKMDVLTSPVDISFSLQQVEGIDIASPTGERNRGGLSVIVVTDDLRGIELHFQHDQIISLDDAHTSFPVAEVVEFDTSNPTDYELRLADEGYVLRANGDVLLQGALRDYSAIAPAPPFSFPYTTPNFLFVGDNTRRAGADTLWSRFAVSLSGDCNDDGSHLRDDLRCLRSAAERDDLLRALDIGLGDLDANGQVEFVDFLVLSANFGRTEATYAEGNLDLDSQGRVSFPDFLILSRQFGAHGLTSRSVPEPDALLIWLVISSSATSRWLRSLKR